MTKKKTFSTFQENLFFRKLFWKSKEQELSTWAGNQGASIFGEIKNIWK
jgi:hypothetical protein